MEAENRNEQQLPNPSPTSNLNSLPQELLLYIISFFSTLDVINSSYISQRWRNLWCFLPSLDFSFEDSNLLFQTFADRVDAALHLRRPDPSLQSFRLSFPYYQNCIRRVHSWLRAAVNLRPRELCLDFSVAPSINNAYIEYYEQCWYNLSVRSRRYRFSFSLLRGGRVQDLKLTSCFVTLPDDMATINLGSMRSMFLDRIDLRDEDVSNLISGCPNLEEFDLRNCYGVRNLRIRSAMLKKLGIGSVLNRSVPRYVEVEIDCPNLFSLSFSDCECDRIVLNNALALVEFSVHFRDLEYYEDFDLWSIYVRLLLQAPNVEKLCVPNMWFEFLSAEEDHLAEGYTLQNVNHLVLQTGYTEEHIEGIAALLRRCPNLETMVLDSLHTIDGEEESLPEEFADEFPVELNMPRLNQVKMIGYFSTENEVMFASILRTQLPHPELLVFDCRS